MKKVVTILGARPQFIKAAPVSLAFQKSGKIIEKIVHTGQHFDRNMSDIFFNEMKIPLPSYRLNINSTTHGDMTGRMLSEIEAVLLKESPDWVLVYGDTNSTLAGALAASKLHISIAHIESGLRSFNMMMPEEINRIISDRLSRKLFCPTKTAVKNLINEGFESFSSDIFLSGDVMYDASIFFSNFNLKNSIREKIKRVNSPYVLATIHRQESTDNEKNLRAIFKGLNKISEKIEVVFPLHPRTKKYIDLYGIKTNVNFIDPVGYFEMLDLIKNCSLVVTDSGGLQKESYFFDKFCLIAREDTEWVELVEHQYSFLVGFNSEKMISYSNQYVNSFLVGKENLFGLGNASEIICEELIK